MGLGLSLQTGMTRRRRSNPFAALISTLGDGAAQLIAHPLEYGSMFQDRAGTTPVTEPGQLVGLALDWGFTGKKPVPGAERVPATDGGWSISDPSWSISNGVLTSQEPNNITTAVFTVNALAGQTFAVEFEVFDYSGGSVRAELQGGGVDSGIVRSANGVYFQYLRATADRLFFRFIALGGTGFTGKIRNVSVRELPGYHATAISDAARGIFRDEGGLRWIEYNGINTAYQTPVLPAPGVDKAQVFAGVRKLSDASAGSVAELSTSAASNDGTFQILAPFDATREFGFRTGGTTSRLGLVDDNAFSAPFTCTQTGLGDISGSVLTMRINGVAVAQLSDSQGTGNYNPSGTYPLFYGARAGTSLFFSGYHYSTLGPIVRFSAANATAEQIAAAEAFYTERTDL